MPDVVVSDYPYHTDAISGVRKLKIILMPAITYSPSTNEASNVVISTTFYTSVI